VGIHDGLVTVRIMNFPFYESALESCTVHIGAIQRCGLLTLRPGRRRHEPKMANQEKREEELEQA
jgi:hypothetical protein